MHLECDFFSDILLFGGGGAEGAFLTFFLSASKKGLFLSPSAMRKVAGGGGGGAAAGRARLVSHTRTGLSLLAAERGAGDDSRGAGSLSERLAPLVERARFSLPW